MEDPSGVTASMRLGWKARRGKSSAAGRWNIKHLVLSRKLERGRGVEAVKDEEGMY